jgi:hypothetical protein
MKGLTGYESTELVAVPFASRGIFDEAYVNGQVSFMHKLGAHPLIEDAWQRLQLASELDRDPHREPRLNEALEGTVNLQKQRFESAHLAERSRTSRLLGHDARGLERDGRARHHTAGLPRLEAGRSRR